MSQQQQPSTYVPPHLRNAGGGGGGGGGGGPQQAAPPMQQQQQYYQPQQQQQQQPGGYSQQQYMDPQQQQQWPVVGGHQGGRGGYGGGGGGYGGGGGGYPQQQQYHQGGRGYGGGAFGGGNSYGGPQQQQGGGGGGAFQRREMPSDFRQQQQQQGQGGGVGASGDFRSGGGGGMGGGPPPGSRGGDFRSFTGGGGGFGGGGGGGGYGGGGGGRGGYRRGPQVNELGFHGNLYEDRALESEMYGGVQMNSGINFDKYDNIPVETSGENVPPAIDVFVEEMLIPQLVSNTVMAGYTRPTPVQKYSIPIGHSGRDLMACAQTGSGKTGGFLFPTITSMVKRGAIRPQDGGRARTSYPNCLIMAPTRELASQIFAEARKFCYRTGIRPVVIYGGAESREQLNEVDNGCDLLVATPGRLVDFIERGKISLSCVRHLILDEADRMLDMGFEPQIRQIVQESGMPNASGGRMTFMFSATFPKEIQRLASDFLNDYVFLAVGRVGQAANDILQIVEYCENRDKTVRLKEELQKIGSGLILVFVETKKNADRLEFELSNSGFPATSIHGDRTQGEREWALEQFKKGDKPILVATDVASRGLDISGVTNVFNYDMPNTIDDYVHRIGRTGRAGNTGTAFAFINEDDRSIARDLCDLLSEAMQEVPGWLETMAGGAAFGSGGRRGGGRGGRGGGRGGNRDYRHEGRGGGMSGGGGGGSGGGGGGGGHAPSARGGRGGGGGGGGGLGSRGGGGLGRSSEGSGGWRDSVGLGSSSGHSDSVTKGDESAW